MRVVAAAAVVVAVVRWVAPVCVATAVVDYFPQPASVELALAGLAGVA